MRLTKFFSGAGSVDKKINTWAKESPRKRCIVQLVSYREGVLVLYEKISPPREDWESLKRNLMEKPKKSTLKRGSRRGR